MKDYAETLRYANQTIELVERARRQEKRVQRAYRRMHERRDAMDLSAQTSRFAPDEWGDAQTLLDDHLYFLIVVLRQVIRGRELLIHLGHPMPNFREADLIQSWRDVAEHWDDPGRGKPIRALRRWREASSEEEPGLSLSGDYSLRRASGLRLKQVRKDLAKLRRAVGIVSEVEWDRCYLTPSQAASMLGITMRELTDLFPQPIHLDFEDRGGLRYWREAIEARIEGHNFPPRWIEEDWIPDHP